MGARLWLALSLMLSACGFDFDSPSEVRDMRVLGLSTSPPELTTQLFSLDMQTSALVAGVDAGTPVAYVWTTCLALPTGGGGGFGFGSNVQRCAEDGGTTVEASRGVASVDALGATFPLPLPALAVLASGARGLTLSLQVQLQVNDLYAVKQMQISPTLPDGQDPNLNPLVSSLTFDGEDWPAGVVKTLAFDSCPDDKRAMEPGPRGMMMASSCRHEIDPVVDPSHNQVFFDVGLSGEVERQVERMRFSWFADLGGLEQTNTQQPDPQLPLGRKVYTTFWREPKEKPEGPLTLWVVTRDGRGGESWTSRQLLLQ